MSGSTLTLLCLWWSMLTTSVAQHISRSEELALSAISWRRKPLLSWCLLLLLLLLLLFCCFVFLYRLDYCNSLLIDISCDEMYKLPKIQNHAAKTGFRKSRHEQVKPLLKTLHLLPVKEGTIFKLATSVFCFFHGGYCVTIFVIISLCLHSFSFQFGWEKRNKTLFVVQNGNLSVLVTGHSLFRLPLSWTTCPLTSYTAVLSHS